MQIIPQISSGVLCVRIYVAMVVVLVSESF